MNVDVFGRVKSEVKMDSQSTKIEHDDITIKNIVNDLVGKKISELRKDIVHTITIERMIQVSLEKLKNEMEIKMFGVSDNLTKKIYPSIAATETELKNKFQHEIANLTKQVNLNKDKMQEIKIEMKDKNAVNQIAFEKMQREIRIHSNTLDALLATVDELEALHRHKL